MTNRKQRRIKNVKKSNKKVEVPQVDSEVKSFIKIVLGVALIVVIVFGATILMNNLGVFDEGYTKPDRGETAISYETATIGTMFNRPEEEYYLIFDEYTENPNQYLTSILYRYSSEEDKLPIYQIDMNDGFNTKYIGEQGNPSAQKVEDVKINGITLIKISDGKNVKYIEGIENIENELLK